MHPGIPALILSTLLASTALAQTGIGIGRTKTDSLPGDGTLPAGSINITTTAINAFGDDGTGFDDIHGVARLPNGHFIASQGQNGGLTPKKYFEFDSDGSFIGAVQQPFLNGANGDIGHTDLAWDQVDDPSSRLWAAKSKGIMSYNWNTAAFDNTVAGLNGLHILGNFTGAEVRASTIAYMDNPATPAVESIKTFVSADNITGDPDVSNINYHRMDVPLPNFPKLIPDTPNVNGTLGVPDLGKMGAAYDPNSQTIWWHIDSHSVNPNPNESATRFFEMDLDGNLTGKVVQGDRSIGGIARGCEIYVDANGNSVMAYVVSMGNLATSPLGLTQDQDVLVEMYMGFEFGGGCQGRVGFLTEPYIGNADFAITITDGDNGMNPLNAAILIRGGAEANGLHIPGINNCPLNISLGSFNNRGTEILSNGAATFPRPLPNDPGLVGVEATWQWLLPTSAAILPLDLTTAGSIRIGTNL